MLKKNNRISIVLSIVPRVFKFVNTLLENFFVKKFECYKIGDMLRDCEIKKFYFCMAGKRITEEKDGLSDRKTKKAQSNIIEDCRNMSFVVEVCLDMSSFVEDCLFSSNCVEYLKTSKRNGEQGKDGTGEKKKNCPKKAVSEKQTFTKIKTTT